jgi:hypothetical protein
MYSTAELVRLANVYIDWAGISISRMGELAADNDKLFHRLMSGLDCYASSAERASRFFDRHWPAKVAWPADVRPRCAAASAARTAPTAGGGDGEHRAPVPGRAGRPSNGRRR